MSRSQNIDDFHAKETWTILATLHGSDKDVLDITGATVTWYMTAPDDLATKLLTASTAGGEITITDATNGKIKIEIPPADQTLVPAGTYYHECVVVLPGGETSIQFHGEFVVNDSALGN